MPIVVCPGCGAKINAPDTSAGKRVKCPKPNCGTAITVPPQSEAVAEEEDAPKKSQKNPFDFDDEEDEAPKRTKKKPRAEEDDTDEDEKPKKRRAKDDDDA